MRARSLVLVASLASGCGSQLRREVVGVGGGSVQLRGQVAAAPATTIALGHGRFDIALTFDVPRAQAIDYELQCAGLPTRHGQVGETFEQYRARRIQQLNELAERDRRAMASVTSTVVGQVAPTVRAQGQVTTPTATASVDAQVSGQQAGAAAGTAVAQEAFPAITELPPGDIGQGRLAARVEMTVGAPITCALIATADDANVNVGYQITQIHDLDQEAAERRVAAKAGAFQVRAQLTAQLTLAGADKDALARRRFAEAQARERARAEAEAARERARAEAQAERDRKKAERDRIQAERDRVRLAAEAEADAAHAAAQAERDRVRLAAQAETDAAQAERDRVRLAAQAEADAAHAQAQAERDRVQRERTAKLELEAHAKLDIRIRREERVRQTRTLLVAYLAGECHADPGKLQRDREANELRIRVELQARQERELTISAERDARNAKLQAERDARSAAERAQREQREAFERDQRAAREAKAQYERDQRAAFELEQRRAREAVESQRIEVALTARANLRAYLVGIGARERPPMPALLVEAPGTQPFDGAVWIAGNWSWTGGQWMWTAGGWQDQSRFGDSGTVGGNVKSTASVAVEVQAPATTVTATTAAAGTATTAATTTTTATATGTATASGSTGATIVIPTIPVSIDAGISIGGSRRKSTGSGPTVRDHRH